MILPLDGFAPWCIDYFLHSLRPIIAAPGSSRNRKLT
jgi:hypothetical protein